MTIKKKSIDNMTGNVSENRALQLINNVVPEISLDCAVIGLPVPTNVQISYYVYNNVNNK